MPCDCSTRIERMFPPNPNTVTVGISRPWGNNEKDNEQEHPFPKKNICQLWLFASVFKIACEEFLDALATLGLMIVTHWLTDQMEIYYSIPPQVSPLKLRLQPVTQNGMSFKMECHSKWNNTQNGMSLIMECHSKRNVAENGMSLKMECHSKCNVTQDGMSLEIECHSKWNVT